MWVARRHVIVCVGASCFLHTARQRRLWASRILSFVHSLPAAAASDVTLRYVFDDFASEFPNCLLHEVSLDHVNNSHQGAGQSNRCLLLISYPLEFASDSLEDQSSSLQVLIVLYGLLHPTVSLNLLDCWFHPRLDLHRGHLVALWLVLHSVLFFVFLYDFGKF